MVRRLHFFFRECNVGFRNIQPVFGEEQTCAKISRKRTRGKAGLAWLWEESSLDPVARRSAG
jgi:hypothetical protein